MPTRHYTVSGTPTEVLAALKTAALELGWQYDSAASGPLLLALKRGANEKTFGWSISISVVDDAAGTTALLATTDDADHNKTYLQQSHAIHELFAKIGATGR